MKDQQLFNHFRDLNLDLSLIMVENFLTVFTNTCDADISAVIIDHLLIDGAVVLIKAMILILGYLRKELLELETFGTIYILTCR